jgi:hypothetical protein
MVTQEVQMGAKEGSQGRGKGGESLTGGLGSSGRFWWSGTKSFQWCQPLRDVAVRIFTCLAATDCQSPKLWTVEVY